MAAPSCRLLLLATIVLSNFITSTTSRHHHGHNSHQHRTRHRRQGAGLYLPASYIIPGGEGSGPWGDWGDISPCSRTCGGGVASQKRICLEPGPQKSCTGGDTKYFSCQTQDCPAGSGDFRAEQCAEFNDKEFEGKFKYNWVPFKKASNPCELNCMPQGARFYNRLKLRVADGTRCNDDSFDVCVDGVCQHVGCDMMLGSSASEDKCRVCRGNGTNCHTIEGLFNSQDLLQGYNDILLIPEGSTNIVFEEMEPSNNYLALRATNDTYYLNGLYHIDFPRTIMIAGALWTYERSRIYYPAPDKLRCLGPITEPLYLSLLLDDVNVGIKYEYSIPNEATTPTDGQYNWVHEDFTPCSATCCGGFQTRNVTCRSREELELVDDKLCDEGLKPPTNQSCNQDPCPAQWVAGPWGDCSQNTSGIGCTRTREVTCQKVVCNGIAAIVPDKECFELLGPKPELTQKCNENVFCPAWFVGHWTPCDQLCDEGKQTRQVVCRQKIDGRVKVLDDGNCTDEKPATEQTCMIQPCDGVDWVTSDWSECDTCMSRGRSRTVLCVTALHIAVNDSFCSHHRRPVERQECDRDMLPQSEAQWHATDWSMCPVGSGDGVQTRSVFCGVYTNESVQRVEDSKCAHLLKCNDTKPCSQPKLWFTGPWSSCSKGCGGGTQRRRVLCMQGFEATDCPWFDIMNMPDEQQLCNNEPCGPAIKHSFNLDAKKLLCNETKFGCCPDNKTAALGPFDVGCDKPRTCQESRYGCCPDGVSPKLGETDEGCPVEPCADTLFGCLSDNKTAAQVPDDPVRVPASIARDMSPAVTGELGSPLSVRCLAYGYPPPYVLWYRGYNLSRVLYNDDVYEVRDNMLHIKNLGMESLGQYTCQAYNGKGKPAIRVVNVRAYKPEGLFIENEMLVPRVTLSPRPKTQAPTTAESTETSTLVYTETTTEADTEKITETTEALETSEGSTTGADTTGAGTTEVGSTTLDLCSGFEFGCCADNQTEAKGPDGQGCPCNATEFGCCPDGVSPAKGADNEGCPGSCSTSPHGCCEDNQTPAHGPDFEGCCLLHAFGCCPDNRKPAEGPHLEGCGCQYSLHGCCPDNVTIAQGPDNQGCGCQYTQHGCCPDRHTAASGPNNEGCDCSTFQFGCCPDGVTTAKGPDQQGCHCRYSSYGCCGDEQTPATGPNAAGCDCSSSKYGCCPDGKTEAAGSKFLGCTDAPENKQAACSLPPDRGMSCHNFTVMWHFDMTYGGCSRFWYRGCEGNGNRFTTKEECEDICVQPSPKDACNLPSVKGACDGSYKRWHYNSTREQCVPFLYGGCRGNANNFETRELCQKQCEPRTEEGQCELPIEPGWCSGNYSRWGFNPSTRGCEQFIWGGCEGNSNRFNTEAACQMRCNPPGSQPPQCAEPQEAGSCANKEALWSFSVSENRCVPFYYSGCGGNNNRFPSREACEQTCPAAYVPDKCTLPSETGQCTNYRQRWFFDTSSKRCRQFYYGGCGGNVNNFATEAKCENSCSELKTTTTTTTTIPTTTTTTARPAEPQLQPGPEEPTRPDGTAAAAPQPLPQKEPEVAASEGGKATLRCLFHSSTPPQITWKHGELTIDGSAGRYRLMSDGALEIVSLYRNDTGVYICMADNGIGIATQEIHLVVNDTVVSRAWRQDCWTHPHEIAPC